MKKSLCGVALALGLLAAVPRADATPIPCIQCGSTPLAAAGIDATLSFAVISGANFNAEVLAHAIGFFGAVPSGTLGPTVNPLASDFVYLYQLVNDGPSNDLIASMSIAGGGIGAGAITAGTRLESTLLVDPSAAFGPLGGLVSAGAAGATSALSAGPSVNFQNGLGDPLAGPVANWGPCLGSGPSGVQCSDGQADLLAASVLVSNWQETPSAVQLDPLWSSSVVWLASPFGPVTGNASIVDVAGLMTAGNVPVPGLSVAEPSSLALLALGWSVLALRRVRARRRS